MWRKLRTEFSLQLLHIIEILLSWRIAVSVAQHLNWRRETLDDSLADPAPPQESVCWIDPIYPITHSVDAISIPVEPNCVNVNFQAGIICQHEGVWRVSLLQEESALL